MPAILISLGDSRWSDRAAGIQEGVLDLHTDFYMHSRGDTTFEDGRNHETLNALGFLDEIYKAVQFFQNEHIQSFTRVSESVIGSTPFVLAFRISFRSRVIDNTLATRQGVKQVGAHFVPR